MANPSGVMTDGARSMECWCPTRAVGGVGPSPWQPTLQRIDTVEKYLIDRAGQNLIDRFSAIQTMSQIRVYRWQRLFAMCNTIVGSDQGRMW